VPALDLTNHTPFNIGLSSISEGTCLHQLYPRKDFDSSVSALDDQR
jgi:hypothetical protein